MNCSSGSELDNAFPDVEGDIATARVLANTFFTFEA